MWYNNFIFFGPLEPHDAPGRPDTSHPLYPLRSEASVKGALKEAIYSRPVENIPQASLKAWMDVDAEKLWKWFDR